MISIIALSFLGGVIPAVLWLEFWLREATHKEPRRLIFGTFVFGMMSVFIAGILEQGINSFVLEYSLLSLILWALIEEILKFTGAAVAGLRSRFCDDAIDPSIYLITSALGFAAAENILFLFEPISSGDIERSISTLSARFVGATLLHIIASGTIGITMGFAFYKSEKVKNIAIFLGIFAGTVLHTAFNSFIILGEKHVVWVFTGIWIGLIIVMLILEKIKNLKRLKHVKIIPKK